MQVAEIYANLSYAQRLKVGSIVVKNDRIISIGYNGMPTGWDNTCETVSDISKYEIEAAGTRIPEIDEAIRELVSKPEVLHAEANAITKLAKSNESGENSIMFVTASPCLECAKLIAQSGIKEIFYKTEYRSDAGIEFLLNCGIRCYKLNEMYQSTEQHVHTEHYHELLSKVECG